MVIFPSFVNLLAFPNKLNIIYLILLGSEYISAFKEWSAFNSNLFPF